jgi:putative membrane protein
MRWSLTAATLATLPAFLMAAAPATPSLAPDRGELRSTFRPQHPDSALDDPTIVAIFDAANTADIETGSLGAKRGHDKAVREYAAMLAHDHTTVRQLGRDLARKLGVTPTPPADRSSAEAHARAMASLRAKDGVEFDRAFLQHEVAFHQAVINAIQTTLLPAIQNAELKALVVKVAPAFQAHMLAAQQLEKQLGQQVGVK